MDTVGAFLLVGGVLSLLSLAIAWFSPLNALALLPLGLVLGVVLLFRRYVLNNPEYDQDKKDHLPKAAWSFFAANAFTVFGFILLPYVPEPTGWWLQVLATPVVLGLHGLIAVQLVLAAETDINNIPADVEKLKQERLNQAAAEQRLKEKLEKEKAERAVVYLEWIRNHKPSLPDRAKQAYLGCAEAIVETYQTERLDPTSDALVNKRRERETIRPIEDVQLELFERYKKLVADLPERDGVAPFPLFPQDPRADAAFAALEQNTWFESWSGKGSPILFQKVKDAFTPIQNGKKRFEGTFILAPSGSGKTTLLNYIIGHDFDYLAFTGIANRLPVGAQPSIVAMDSTGDFIKNWLPRRHFGPEDGPYLDRLVIIEPDVEHPIALNPFAYGRERINAASGNDRVRLTNQTIDLLTHVFSSVGDNTAFTSRQRLVFGHCVRLCMAVPNATMQTLHDILATASIEPYREYVRTLSEEAQSFFATTFPTLKKVCQEELLWRVQLVVENEAFAPMVKAPDCKIDFGRILNDSSFVLIHADRTILGEKGVAVFGRLMIALIRLAMKERDKIPEEARKPVYFFIDESQEYLDNDDQVASMIDDVRKSRLALTFVTQRLAKIKDSNVKDALLSCGILLAKPTNEDANTMGRYMGISEFYLNKHQFMLSARGVTGARPVSFPPFQAKLELSESEQRRARQYVRGKYGYTREAPPRSPEPPKPVKRSTDDDDDLTPTSKL